MIGKIVHDYALGKYGFVIGGPWTEPDRCVSEIGTGRVPQGTPIKWEWLVLYNDGEQYGADTNDLQEIK